MGKLLVLLRHSFKKIVKRKAHPVEYLQGFFFFYRDASSSEKFGNQNYTYTVIYDIQYSVGHAWAGEYWN